MAVCSISNLVSLATAPWAGMKPRRRKAVLIYMLAKKVTASGGVNYLTNPNALFAAAASWRAMRRDQRDAALIEIAKEVAVAAGATIPSDINAIAQDTPEFEEYHDQFILYVFLRCLSA